MGRWGIGTDPNPSQLAAAPPVFDRSRQPVRTRLPGRPRLGWLGGERGGEGGGLTWRRGSSARGFAVNSGHSRDATSLCRLRACRRQRVCRLLSSFSQPLPCLPARWCPDLATRALPSLASREPRGCSLATGANRYSSRGIPHTGCTFVRTLEKEGRQKLCETSADPSQTHACRWHMAHGIVNLLAMSPGRHPQPEW